MSAVVAVIASDMRIVIVVIAHSVLTFGAERTVIIYACSVVCAEILLIHTEPYHIIPVLAVSRNKRIIGIENKL